MAGDCQKPFVSRSVRWGELRGESCSVSSICGGDALPCMLIQSSEEETRSPELGDGPAAAGVFLGGGSGGGGMRSEGEFPTLSSA